MAFIEELEKKNISLEKENTRLHYQYQYIKMSHDAKEKMIIRLNAQHLH